MRRRIGRRVDRLTVKQTWLHSPPRRSITFIFRQQQALKRSFLIRVSKRDIPLGLPTWAFLARDSLIVPDLHRILLLPEERSISGILLPQARTQSLLLVMM